MANMTGTHLQTRRGIIDIAGDVDRRGMSQ